MKKTYMIPEMEVIEVATNQQLMAGSPGYDPTEVPAGSADAREMFDELDFMFDD